MLFQASPILFKLCLMVPVLFVGPSFHPGSCPFLRPFRVSYPFCWGAQVLDDLERADAELAFEKADDSMAASHGFPPLRAVLRAFPNLCD